MRYLVPPGLAAAVYAVASVAWSRQHVHVAAGARLGLVVVLAVAVVLTWIGMARKAAKARRPKRATPAYSYGTGRR